jgi:excisionase family DNA binding protein
VKKSAKKSKVVRRMKATSNGHAMAELETRNAVKITAAKLAKHSPISMKPAKDQEDQILTVPMLAEYLLCHPSTIYRLLKNKRIPGFRVGSDWRFRRSAIDQWLNRATIATGR